MEYLSILGLSVLWLLFIGKSVKRKEIKSSGIIVRATICAIFITLGYVVFFTLSNRFNLFSYVFPLFYSFVDSTYVENIKEHKNSASKSVIAVMRSNTSFAKSMHDFLELAFEESGIGLKFMDVEEEENVDSQVGKLKEALKEKPDAIILMPISSNNQIIEIVIKAITEYKIPVITIDRKLNTEEFYNKSVIPPIHIRSDFWQGGCIAAEMMANDVGKVGKFFIISGPKDSEEANERKRAFMEEIIDRLPGSGIYCEYTRKWGKNEATAIMRRILKKHSIIDGVFCANDTLAIGALKAIEKQNLTIPIIGYDGIDEIKEKIKDGKILGSVDVKIKLQAERVFQVICELIIDQEKPKVLMNLKDIPITPEPLDRTKLGV